MSTRPVSSWSYHPEERPGLRADTHEGTGEVPTTSDHSAGRQEAIPGTPAASYGVAPSRAEAPSMAPDAQESVREPAVAPRGGSACSFPSPSFSRGGAAC